LSLPTRAGDMVTAVTAGDGGYGRHGGYGVAAGQTTTPIPPVHYKQRNTVERAINELKAFRAVATRYDKPAYIYQRTIDIASIKIGSATPSHDPRETLLGNAGPRTG
jgi:hypothetical protein